MRPGLLLLDMQAVLFLHSGDEKVLLVDKAGLVRELALNCVASGSLICQRLLELQDLLLVVGDDVADAVLNAVEFDSVRLQGELDCSRGLLVKLLGVWALLACRLDHTEYGLGLVQEDGGAGATRILYLGLLLRGHDAKKRVGRRVPTVVVGEGDGGHLARSLGLEALDELVLPDLLVKFEEKLAALSLPVEGYLHVIDRELTPALGLGEFE